MDPSIQINAVLALASLGVLWVTWRSHRHARKTGYIGELRGELDLMHEKLDAARKLALDQGAVIADQRTQIADLTVREAECRADNQRLSGRVEQLQGDVNGLNQLVGSLRIALGGAAKKDA
jgi:hypothetical protein